MRRPSVIALIAITIVFVASTLPANAGFQAAEDPGAMTVIALDAGAATSQNDLAMMETALMTLAGNLGGGSMTVMRYGQEVSPPVTADAGADLVGVAREQLQELRRSEPLAKSDQFNALTSAFSFMTRINAERGSRVFVITPGRILGESENTGARFNSVGELFANEGWSIDVATLMSTEAALRGLMSQLSTSSGGEYFDLGQPDGLQSLLFTASSVDLDTVIEAELNGSEVRSTFEVAPMTDSAKVAFLRFSPDTKLALFNPNGSAASALAEDVDIIESPNVVIYSLTNPAAGTWTAMGTGERGKLVTGVDARTSLAVQLNDQPPVPLFEPGLLTASTTVAGETVSVPGTVVTATVRQADGFTNVFQMNDEGLAGDATAGDGVFSLRLPASEAQGINDVSLAVTWPDLNARIVGAGFYKTELFPAVRVTRMFDVSAHDGDEVNLGTIESFVGEFPYLASPDEFEVRIVSTAGETAGWVVPRSEPEPGKGFAFDVLAVLPSTGDYSVSVTMNTEYLGRDYLAAGPAISTNATITPQPFLILGLPVWAWVIIGVAAFAGLVLVTVQSRRVKPFGYIYDDQDNLLVDFKNLKRGWIKTLTSADTVHASEVRGLPFRAGTFKFGRGSVELQYGQDPDQPSLRVNSRPAPDVVTLQQDVWLGVSGKLLTFTTEMRPRLSMAFAPADD